MNAESFLDTNLFIYQLEARDDRKSAIADAIIRDGIATGNACISYQVVQECINTVLRKAEVPLDVSGARAYLDHVLTLLLRVPSSPHLFHRALDIQDRYHFGFYEWLITTAAMATGCTRILAKIYRMSRWQRRQQ
jgi:predicted nucleic acid-binding protein